MSMLVGAATPFATVAGAAQVGSGFEGKATVLIPV